MELTPSQMGQIKEIARQFRLKMILLFGSSVEGPLHPNSDLDLALLREGEKGSKGKGNQNLSLGEYADLLYVLQQVFPHQEIDLSFINRADPLFLKKILENCQLIFGSPKKLQELKIYAFKRYQDHRPYFIMEEQFVQRYLKRAQSK